MLRLDNGFQIQSNRLETRTREKKQAPDLSIGSPCFEPDSPFGEFWLLRRRRGGSGLPLRLRLDRRELRPFLVGMTGYFSSKGEHLRSE